MKCLKERRESQWRKKETKLSRSRSKDFLFRDHLIFENFVGWRKKWSPNMGLQTQTQKMRNKIKKRFALANIVHRCAFKSSLLTQVRSQLCKDAAKRNYIYDLFMQEKLRNFATCDLCRHIPSEGEELLVLPNDCKDRNNVWNWNVCISKYLDRFQHKGIQIFGSQTLGSRHFVPYSKYGQV